MTGQERTRQELAQLAPSPEPQAIAAVDNGEKSLYFNPAKFEQAYRASKLLASSQLVPEQYRNQSQNCFIALQVADRMQIDPFLYMQNTYVVHGKPGLNGALAIALINKSGPFIEPIAFEYKGKYGVDRRCKATGILESGRVCEATITWEMVKAEGWLSNSKWTSIPDQMLSYRSAAFLGRLYCPEVLMGMQTVDELIDAGPQLDPEAHVPLPEGNEGLKALLGRTEPATAPVEEELKVEPIPEAAAEQLKQDIEKMDAVEDEVMVGEYEPRPKQFCQKHIKLELELDHDGNRYCPACRDAVAETQQSAGPGVENAEKPVAENIEKMDAIEGDCSVEEKAAVDLGWETPEPEPVYTCPTCKTETPKTELKTRKSQRADASGVKKTLEYCPKCLVVAKSGWEA
jgi:hypothetical protein